MKYTLLKNCIRGKVGAKADVHGNDIATLDRLGVINKSEHDKKESHQPKAETKAPSKAKAK